MVFRGAHNTFKRVAASAVSLFTVAGMMPTTVGSFLTSGSAIVAYAQEVQGQSFDVKGATDYITSISVAMGEENTVTMDKTAIKADADGIINFEAAKNKPVTIKSALPLTFEGVLTKAKIESEPADGPDKSRFEWTEEGYKQNTYDFVNEQYQWQQQQVTKSYVVDVILGIDLDEEAIHADSEGNLSCEFEPDKAGTLSTGYTYTFIAPGCDLKINAANVDVNAEVNVTMEKEYIKSMTVEPLSGESIPEITYFGRNKDFVYEAKFGDKITLKSAALLKIAAGDVNGNWNTENPANSCFKGKDTDGLYKYEFVLSEEDLFIETAKANLTVPDGAVVKDNYNNKTISAEDENEDPDFYTVVAGLRYTVTKTGVPAEKSMNLGDTAVDPESSLVKEKNEAGQETGAKTYTSVFTVFYDDVIVELGPHAHQRKYTVEGNKVYVECVAPELDLAKQVAAEVTIDFGKDNDGNFVSAKGENGTFTYDGENYATVFVNITDFDAGEAVESYVAAPVIEFYDDKNNVVQGQPKAAGKYKAVVTFTKTNKTGGQDVGDNNTVKVEQSFEIRPKAVTNGRISFRVDEEETTYLYNEKTGTYQIYIDGDLKVITPTILVDGVEIENFVNENAAYYATGTTSAKYPGVNTINITSNDPNNSTGDDLVVKWEIVQKPIVTLGNTETSYTGEEDEVIAAIKDTEGFFANIDNYELRFADEFDVEAEVTEAAFNAATTEVPINAKDTPYTVFVKYIENQVPVYKKAPLQINPMKIKVTANGYKKELNFGDKQSVATADVVDENNKVITDQFVNQDFVLMCKEKNAEGDGEVFNTNEPYNVGEYVIYVTEIDTLGSGNSNYIADNAWDGTAGAFEVKPAIVSTDFTSVIVPTENVANDSDFYRIDERDIAAAYNFTPEMTADDVVIVGGEVTAKNVTNRSHTVLVEFKNNFRTEDGKPVELTWAIGSRQTVALTDFTPKYNEDLKACTVVATVKKLDTKAAVKEWGLVYENRANKIVDPANYKEELKEGFGTSSYKFKVAKASAENNDTLEVIIANSFVDRQVYAMAYVIYEDGTVEFDDRNAEVTGVTNYFNLVFDGLKIEDQGSLKYGEKETPCVKFSIKREEAKGYEVTEFGYLYNNKGNLTSAAGAQNWISFESTDKNMKRADASLDALEYTGIVANSKPDVKVYAKAFVTVKDKAGNTKTFLTEIKENPITGIFQYPHNQG